MPVNIRQLLKNAISQYAHETKDLEFLPQNRYNKALFLTTGQYDWFSGQILYCLIRYCKPRKILEISTASGYATLFMALALKRNNWGKIDTHEVDPKASQSARRRFIEYQVDAFVESHVGDARKTSVNAARDYAIYFLDSLHAEEFARWFIESHVLHSDRIDALFHMHDILPLHARVRRWDAPPFEGSDLDPNASKSKKGVFSRLLNHIRKDNHNDEAPIPLQVFPAEDGEEFQTFNGNCTSEAVWGNKLAATMNPMDHVFLYDLIPDYPELSPAKYNETVIGRADSRNRPMEWNESWWCTVAALKKVYRQLPGSGQQPICP